MINESSWGSIYETHSVLRECNDSGIPTTIFLFGNFAD